MARISVKKYLEAKKIIEQYEAERKTMQNNSAFKIGDKVYTTKGCRFGGQFSGTIVGFGKWNEFDAAKVKKHIGGKVVLCLAKNLKKI